MASPSYLVRCVFPSSVPHTGRAWEARCTAAVGAERENTTQVGRPRTRSRGCSLAGNPPIAHPHPREARCGCSACLPLTCLSFAHLYPWLLTKFRTGETGKGGVGRLVQGRRDREATMNVSSISWHTCKTPNAFLRKNSEHGYYSVLPKKYWEYGEASFILFKIGCTYNPCSRQHINLQ